MIAMLTLALTAAQIGAAPILSVPGLWARHAAPTGRLVRVHGWMTACRSLACGLAADPSAPGSASDRVLSIGDAPGFYARAAAREGRAVTVAGWFDDSYRTRMICTDRAPELRSVAIAADGDALLPLVPSEDP